MTYASTLAPYGVIEVFVIVDVGNNLGPKILENCSCHPALQPKAPYACSHVFAIPDKTTDFGSCSTDVNSTSTEDLRGIYTGTNTLYTTIRFLGMYVGVCTHCLMKRHPRCRLENPDSSRVDRKRRMLVLHCR